MKKNNLFDGEIDFLEFIKIIWNGKTIVILTVLISVAIFSFNFVQKPESYNVSINVKPSKASEFDQFLLITSFINDHQIINKSKSAFNMSLVTNKEVYNKFIYLLNDHELMMNILKKNRFVKNSISKLSEDDKKSVLYGYSQLIRAKNTEKDFIEHTINFEWQNKNEANEILTHVINLTIQNLAKQIFLDFINRINLYQNIYERKNLSRIEYLLEQNEIAKELNIANNQINSVNLYQSNDLLNMNNSEDNIPYYLRGYKAIEKEIYLIRNRDFETIKNLKKYINTLESNAEINWVELNIYSISVKSTKNFNNHLNVSIILGLIIGVFFVLIYRAYQSSKLLKKNN